LDVEEFLAGLRFNQRGKLDEPHNALILVFSCLSGSHFSLFGAIIKQRWIPARSILFDLCGSTKEIFRHLSL
jgi:hypothetical protein